MRSIRPNHFDPRVDDRFSSGTGKTAAYGAVARLMPMRYSELAARGRACDSRLLLTGQWAEVGSNLAAFSSDTVIDSKESIWR